MFFFILALVFEVLFTFNRMYSVTCHPSPCGKSIMMFSLLRLRSFKQHNTEFANAHTGLQERRSAPRRLSLSVSDTTCSVLNLLLRGTICRGLPRRRESGDGLWLESRLQALLQDIGQCVQTSSAIAKWLAQASHPLVRRQARHWCLSIPLSRSPALHVCRCA